MASNGRPLRPAESPSTGAARAEPLGVAAQSLAALPFGQVILWLVGAGLIVYGVYCFARAKYARL